MGPWVCLFTVALCALAKISRSSLYRLLTCGMSSTAAIDTETFTSFTDLLEHFTGLAAKTGTMIGRETKNFKPEQFSKAFPGLEFTPTASYGYLYCIINPKHGISPSKVEGALGNRRSK